MKRRLTMVAVGAVLSEIGFDCAEPYVLDVLSEMIQSFITEAGSSSRQYCELAGRTEPLFADVLMALVNMGVKVNELEKLCKKRPKMTVVNPVPSSQPKQLSILQAGVKQPHPSYIAPHLPSFPDPHAYIRTPTHKQPVTEYEAIREKAAQQKRDIERALNKFEAKTGETDGLFLTSDSMFPLIACKIVQPAYMTALVPKDQVFEMEDSEVTSLVERKSRGSKEPAVKEEEDSSFKGDPESIDNPYLRPVKNPAPKVKIKTVNPPSFKS